MSQVGYLCLAHLGFKQAGATIKDGLPQSGIWSLRISMATMTSFTLENIVGVLWSSYAVTWQSGRTWCGWIDGINRGCYETINAPSYVFAHSEVHVSPQNELNTHFVAIYYRTSTGTWVLFDQELWVADWPYRVQKYHTYDYLTYGP